MSRDGVLDPVTRRGVRSGALLLLLIAGGAHAGAIYRCVHAGAAPAFQATPCPTHAAQTVMHVRVQPLIDADKPVTPAAPSGHAGGPSSRGPLRNARSRGQSHHTHAQATFWECRAADGEVFYRHSRCPHSVAGDGVMRSGGRYVVGRGRGRRGARDAWSPVTVHAHKVSRSEACRQINAVAAVERDGSARDERVSAYEHDLGRDPCTGY